MADGVAVTAGAGTTIATDDTGASGHVQINKLAISTDGSATLIPATSDGLAVLIRPETGNGLDTFRSLDLDETEEDVKTSAGQLYGVWFGNQASTIRYLKLYNATAASTTVGVTTPQITFPLPATSAGWIPLSPGVKFTTAICAAATTGVADADTGAPAANDVVVNIFYK